MPIYLLTQVYIKLEIIKKALVKIENIISYL